MDTLISTIRYISRLTQHPLTSLLGLIGAVFALWQVLRPGHRKNLSATQPERRRAQHAAKPAGLSHSHAQGHSSGQAGILAGAKHVTIAAPGVLLEETSAAQLEDAATLRPDAPALLQQACRDCSSCCVLTCVESDVGRSAVSGAFEAAGLLGSGHGQLPPHRLLFCSTEDGKASMVRQLSPDVHIDTSRRSVLALQRFTRRLVLLQPQPTADPELLQNVSVVSSLAASAL